MKAKIAVDIVVDGRDRTLCGKSCPYLEPGGPGAWCGAFGRKATALWVVVSVEPALIKRCRACIAREVRPRTKR